MKKPRLHRWRWLLALLLGAGTWWGVGWWLGPRVHFEATYKSQDVTKTAKAVLNALGFEADTSYVQWDVHIWDRQGRYLLVGSRWAGRVPNCYDLIDLQTGKTLVKQRLTATAMEFDDRWHDIRTAHANGDNFGFKYQSSYAPDDDTTRDRLAQEILNGSIVFRLDRERRRQHEHEIVFRTELWSWNALSNQEKLIRPFSVNSQLKISHDGATLLEIERVTPMLPNFLMHLSLSNVLTAQVTAEMGLDDLAVMRVWNLPELTLRSTISVPWMHRQGQAEITADGSYVVMRDVNLPSEYTSKHHYQYELSHHGHKSIQDAYASSPTGMRVYETQTGNLWWEKSDYAGVYTDYLSVGRDLVQFSKMRDSLLKQPDLLLYLPTKQVIETNYCPSAEQLEDGKIQYSSLNNNDNQGFEIIVADREGNRNRLQTILAQPYFVRSAPQYLRRVTVQNVDKIPVWLHSLLRKWNWSNLWLDEFSDVFSVVDYSVNRSLMSFPISKHEHVDFNMTDRWLVVKQDNEDSCKISVYPLPFPSWSPWWPRAAGFLITLLVWLALSRYTRRPAVLT